MKRIFAVLLTLALLCGAALAESTLNVTGSGTVYVVADQVSVSLGVSLGGTDLADLQSQANQAISNICAVMQAAGLDGKSISTNYIYMYPQYDYSGETEAIVGYTVNSMLTVRTADIDSIGAYIDAAFAAGANSFDSISFSVTDDSDAKKRALELAVADATAKAETIAEATGKTLGDIVTISEGETSDYYTTSGGVGRIENYAMSDAAAATDVRAAQVSVSAEVQISYSIQ